MPRSQKLLYWLVGFSAAAVIGIVISAYSQTTTGGGFPSRPIFAQSTVQSTGPDYRMYESDGPTNEKAWRFIASAGDFYFSALDDTYSSGTSPLMINRTGTTVDLIGFTATNVTVNSNTVAVVTTSVQTNLTLNECSSGGTFDLSLKRAGDSVTARITPTASCVSGTINQPVSGAVIPAGFRPLTNVGCAAQVMNNSVPEMGFINITGTGVIEIRRGGDGTYTAAGNKGLNRSVSCSWPIN